VHSHRAACEKHAETGWQKESEVRREGGRGRREEGEEGRKGGRKGRKWEREDGALRGRG